MSDRLDAYIAFLERLTLERLDELDALVTPDVRFKDPFNDLRGAQAMKRALAMAFDHGPPRFEVIDREFNSGLTDVLKDLNAAIWDGGKVA